MALPTLPSLPSPEAAAVKLAIEVLKVHLERQDIRDVVILEAKNAGLQLALEAERYKADARVSGTPNRFGVRGGAKRKPIQAQDADADT